MNKSKKPDVLCLNRNSLGLQHIPLSDTYGIYPFNLEHVSQDQFSFKSRDVVDSSDPEHFKIGQQHPQILTYAIIQHDQQILTYSRKRGAESRLRGSRSIGFGGHVDCEDYLHNDTENPYVTALLLSTARELTEELQYNCIVNVAEFTELIVDQTNPVGQVHVGIPLIIRINSKLDITADPSEISDPTWCSVDELKKDIHLYENWSKLLIERLT